MSFLKTYYKSIFSFLVVAILIGYSGNEASITLKTSSTSAWILSIQASSSDECFSYAQNAIDSIDSIDYSISLNTNFDKYSLNKTKTTAITYKLQLLIYNTKRHKLEQSIALYTSITNTSTNGSFSFLG